MMLPLILLAAMAAAAPPSSHKLVVTKDFYPESLVVYSGSHDIVEITVPLNQLNKVSELFDTNDSNELSEERIAYVFFVEAEVKDDAVKEYKGVYVFNNGKATKVLDKGQSVTYGDGKTIYIGASDGIYMYNPESGTVEKYGSFTENIIKVVRDTFHRTTYYLTADYVMYKFGDGETKGTKVETVKDARDMVFDYDGHMVYYDGSKQLFVYKDNQVIKIEGLTSNPTKVALMKTPYHLKHCWFVVVDSHLYEITMDGKSDMTPVEFNVMPTAFTPETNLILYSAYNKNIYEYNVVDVIKNHKIEALNKFVAGKKEESELISMMKSKTL